MAAKHWTLIDVEKNHYVRELTVGPQDVGGSDHNFSVKKRRLEGGLQDGVDVVEIDNGALRFVVLPTRGMGLWKAWLGTREIGWQSPVRGPVHPKFVPDSEPSGLGWLDGFDELLVRCGLVSNGAPEFDAQNRLLYGLHGRIANRPASRLELSFDPATAEIALAGIVEEARFLFHRLELRSTVRTRLGEPGLRIDDEVTNRSTGPAGIELLYHINFGHPWLAPGARVVVPVDKMMPRNEGSAMGIADWQSFGQPRRESPEHVFYFELAADAGGQTQVLLKNAQGSEGVALKFSKQQLPCFTLWKCAAPAAEGYVTGLEPGTNFPNPRSFEQSQQRVVNLAGGATARFELALDIHADPAGVSAAEAAINKLQAGHEPRVFALPQPGWTLAD